MNDIEEVKSLRWKFTKLLNDHENLKFKYEQQKSLFSALLKRNADLNKQLDSLQAELHKQNGVINFPIKKD